MKKKVRIYKNPEMKKGGDFKPHMMYDPKTGQGYEAKTMEDHLRMKEMGYLHDDELPKKQMGANIPAPNFDVNLMKSIKKERTPFSSSSLQNESTDEIIDQRKQTFTNYLSDNNTRIMAGEAMNEVVANLGKNVDQAYLDRINQLRGNTNNTGLPAKQNIFGNPTTGIYGNVATNPFELFSKMGNRSFTSKLKLNLDKDEKDEYKNYYNQSKENQLTAQNNFQDGVNQGVAGGDRKSVV